jgi:hypothetical protein
MNFSTDIKELVKATLNDERFREFTIINDSYIWALSIVFFSGEDERAPQDIPAPYVKSTGAIVGGVNIAPRSSNTVYVDPSIQCQPNVIQCRANLKNVNTGGEFLEFKFQDRKVALDEYLSTVTFKLVDRQNLQAEILGDTSDAPVMSVELNSVKKKA